ncbi:Glucan 1,3-beta-glucosidase [Leucoagaricus sp. SymC.cos]|nr:Glucan 1,3-beta-glucosidase [Leucoagaricus sp. SymC.cos]
MVHSAGLRIILTAMLGLSVARSVLGATWGFPYGQEKVRGVNLGGWLVLEPWITPSIFDNTGDNRVVDEWTFGQYVGEDEAKRVLKNHWDTWITEQDFEDIANAGLNHVRLPIGYWAFETKGGEPYHNGQLPYMEKAFQWAAKYNLKVIVDLHGAPGSQNGFDNSGQRLDRPTWQDKQENVDRTNAIIERIASEVTNNVGVVPIIAPLNEPAGFVGGNMLDVTRAYWKSSYQNIRYPYGDERQSNTVVMIHDAFQPLSYWNGFMAPSDGYNGVILDTHIYQVFSDEQNGWSQAVHIQQACSRAGDLIGSSGLWTVVGEWSPAMTDCATYLNGRGVGARFDGSKNGSSFHGTCVGKTGNGSLFTPNYRTFLRKFWEAQTITYEKAQGWIQWTWKAENADEWSYQAGLKYGWIPKNPTDRKYPNICN